ncbi:MAG: response regulator, partial [Syntrophaceae bacterium]|nr:response regulator [Syntrophaceae bacterium]MBP8666517.1 response regulator [Syntrophaceae bacterium]
MRRAAESSKVFSWRPCPDPSTSLMAAGVFMKARIIVIDDDAVACEFLQEVLQRDGYDVSSFTSASAALKQNLADYDLLMSDIRMPG